eukprot:264005-Amphidinium_carterae.1
MAPQRLIIRLAALFVALFRLTGDRDMSEQVPLSHAGAPTMIRPTTWEEFLALLALEHGGGKVFPAQIFRHSARASQDIGLMALVLCRTISVEGRPMPYLGCWPALCAPSETIRMLCLDQAITIQ